MNELANIYRGKSFSIGFTIPDEYDESRIEDLKVNIGTKVYQHTIVQGVIGVNLTSNDTAKMVGRQDVVLTIEDSLFGVQKINCGYVYVSSTISKFQSESFSDVYDVMVMLSFYSERLSVDHVLFDYLKGKSAYEYAVEGGYLGTEEQFYLDLAKAAVAVPYTGADKDVDLGANGITVDNVIFNEEPVSTIDPLKLQYNPAEKTIEFGLKDGGILQLGKEMFEEYTNIDTVALTNGMIVSTAAISGNRKGIKRTDFTSLTSIRSIVGMVTVASIGTNQSGRVTTKGIINDLNTNGIGEGSQLWGNPSVLGGWSGSKPAKPQYAVQIGQVVVAHATVGSVEFNIAKDVKFSDLADVNGSTNLIDNADTIPKRDADGIIREISVADIKADFKADTDLIYEPLLGFTPENTANKGQANGYASLDGDGLVPAAQLPSFVDDLVDAYGTYTDNSDPETIIELWTDATHTVAVEKYTGKIYVDVVTRFQFRWSGSVWGPMRSGPVQSVAGKTGNVLLVKSDVGLGNVDNTSDVNKPVSTLQQNALDLKIDKTLSSEITTVGDSETMAVKASDNIWKRITWSNIKATLKTYFETLFVTLTGAQNIAGVKTFTDSPVVPTPVNNTDAANKAYVQSIITVGNDTYQENKLITDARVASLENTLNSANINQETTATVSGVDTIALPKTAANTGMQVQLFGDSDATKNVIGTGRVRSVGNNLIKPIYIQGFQISTTDGTFVAGATFSRSDYFRVAASTAYVLSSNTNTGTDHRIAFYDSTKVFISGATQTSGQPISVTSPANAYYAIVSSLTTKVDTFRLTRGTASFEPFRQSALYLTTPELRSNGLIKDEIRKGANGYELVKRVGVGTLGATEMVTNGSFGADISGWSHITNGAGNLLTWDATKQAAKLEQVVNISYNYLRQIYNISTQIIPNRWYYFQFKIWLENFTTGTAIEATIFESGTISEFKLAELKTQQQGTWITYRVLHKIQSNATTARFDFRFNNVNVGAIMYVDDVSIKEATITDLATDISFASLIGNNLHYTLATPTITPIAHAGLLNSNSNGTAYFEPIIADAGVYGSNLSIQLTDYPIASFESIRKYANGTYTELNTATAVIASGGLSFTHPNLVSGDLVMFTYAYANESIGRSMTLTHYDSRYYPKYDDEYPSGQWVNAAAAAAPTETNVTIAGVATRKLLFATGDAKSNIFEIRHGSAIDFINSGEMPIEFHVHAMPSTNNAGTAIFTFNWCYSPPNAAPIACTAVDVTITIAANRQYWHLLAGALLTPPTGGFAIGGKIEFTVTRKAAGNTYADGILFDKCALHRPINSMGTKTLYI